MITFLLQYLRTIRTMVRVLTEPQGRALAGLVGVQLLTGTVFYRMVEDWGWVDSLYFSVTTLATVGLGDLAPETTAGKLFTVMFILTGVGLLLSFLTYVGERTGRRHEV